MATKQETETIIAALNAAKAAGDAAALAVWERDERQDRGSCGGAMLELYARSPVAKAAVSLGMAYKSDKVFLSLSLPDGIRSQNGAIPQAQYRAFRESLESAGFAAAVRRFWTYVD